MNKLKQVLQVLFRQRTNLTNLTIFVIVAVWIFTVFSQQQWNKENSVIASDVKGYYAYLPALFIHADLKFENKEVYKGESHNKIWTQQDEQGREYIKYSSGMAIMYSPFFFTAHAISTSFGYQADGFSKPYKLALSIGSLIYSILAILLFGKLLRMHFSDRVTSITLLTIYLGTNLFYYQTTSNTMSHNYSFLLIVLWMYSSVQWLKAPHWKWTIWLGLSGGLMVLIRPIDVIFLSFPFLYGCLNITEFRSRLQLLWNHKGHLVIVIFGCVLVMLPQLFYFKYIFGHYFHYAYSGESFFWTKPRLLDAWFSYRNGWLIYSPIMILSLIGLFFLHKYSKRMRSYAILIFVMYTYVIVCWWCWWYVGFGNRAFINLYPLLAFALAALYTWIGTKRKIVGICSVFIVLGAIFLSSFQTWQMDKNIIHWDAMTKGAYWDVWGRTEGSQLLWMHLRVPDFEAGKKGIDLVTIPVVDTLEDQSLFNPEDHLVYMDPKNKNLLIPQDKDFALHSKAKIHPEATNLYFTAWVKNADKLNIVFDKNEGKDFYSVSHQREEWDGEWQKLHSFINISPGAIDSLRFYFWKQDKNEVFVRDMNLKAYKIHPVKE